MLLVSTKSCGKGGLRGFPGGLQTLVKHSLWSVLILLCVPALQMVCGFLQKASAKLTSPESSEFAR